MLNSVKMSASSFIDFKASMVFFAFGIQSDIFTELSIYISPLPKEKEEFEKVCTNYIYILYFDFCK